MGISPDRIGHATYLHKGPLGADCSVIQTILKEEIPLGCVCSNSTGELTLLVIFTEMCLTSNMKTRTVSSYQDHQFGFWKSRSHPMAICVSNTASA